MDKVIFFWLRLQHALDSLHPPCKRYILPGGKLLKIFALLIFAGSIVHCAKSEHKQLYIKKAPTHLAQLGYIVTATPDEVDLLKKEAPQVQLRALSLPRNLFEVSGVSEAVLKKTLSPQELTPNVFMKGESAVSRFAKSDFTFQPRNTTPEVETALKTCRRSPQAPAMSLTGSFSPQTLTIELGDSVKLTAVAVANAKVGGEVRFMWDMLPPEFSEQSIKEGFATTQTFTPDNTGLYIVGVIAQGADLSCSLQQIYFMVTSNPEPNNDVQLTSTPDLSLFNHISEISTEAAWSITKGSNVTVAVIDTGVNYNHPGLRDNLKFKASDTNNGSDDDSNGLPDDSLGWDFANGDRFAFDDGGHGSHVAGLVASPLSGIAPEAKILPIKVLDAGGRSDLATFVAAIYYAVDNGAQIINASLGFDTPKGASPFDQILMKPAALVKAIEYAKEKNVLFLAAAGNGDAQTREGFDIKARPSFPASIDMENTLCVAATSIGELTSYSNFSEELVHVAAPGGDQRQFVVSLAKQNPMGMPFAAQSGTSMATPIVSGLAALMLSANPALTPKDIKAILIQTGDGLPTLKNKTVNGKIVNAQQAVQAALDFKPGL